MVIFYGIQNVYSPLETVNAEGAQCEQHFSRTAVTALLVHLCVKNRMRSDRVSSYSLSHLVYGQTG